MIDVTIVVPTFRRPVLLRRALELCMAQRDVPRGRYEILVIDNSPEGSAAELVAAMADASPVLLRYVHERTPGICHARNAGLDNAQGRFVAFLDDDECPSEGWLHHLLDTQARFSADVVFAPVVAIPPDGLDEESARFFEGFFTCNDDHPTGTPVGSTIVTPRWKRGQKAYPRLASGNVLLSVGNPAVGDLRFHPYYALNGGEDTLFFTELAARDVNMVWCAEAIATEDIPLSRMDDDYIVLRAFRGGQGGGRIPMMMRPRRPLVMLWFMATGALQLAVHGPLFVATRLAGSPRRRHHMLKALMALGKIFWMVEPQSRYGVGARDTQSVPVEPARFLAPPGPGEYANRAAEASPSPELSVLIPFYNDDPLPLVRALARQTDVAAGTVETVLFDDGSHDPSLAQSVRAEIARLEMPVRLVSAGRNLGRAGARNVLAGAARAPWVLYLDADMRIRPGFLRRHIEAARSNTFDAAFGGFEAAGPADPARALHVALAEQSDIRDAAARARIGATAFCTSNLLARAALVLAVPFDEGFTGWGWEDVDWAVTAAKQFRLDHLDNPAVHAGWQTAEELLSRFSQASANFALLLAKHPELGSLPSARAAAFLRRVPGQRLLRSVWAATARTGALPLRVRTLSLKLWRASWAAEAIRE